MIVAKVETVVTVQRHSFVDVQMSKAMAGKFAVKVNEAAFAASERRWKPQSGHATYVLLPIS